STSPARRRRSPHAGSASCWRGARTCRRSSRWRSGPSCPVTEGSGRTVGERPPSPSLDANHHGRADGLGPRRAVLLVLRPQQLEGAIARRAGLLDAGLAVGADPPQPLPVLVVLVDEERDARIRRDVAQA